MPMWSATCYTGSYMMCAKVLAVRYGLDLARTAEKLKERLMYLCDIAGTSGRKAASIILPEAPEGCLLKEGDGATVRFSGMELCRLLGDEAILETGRTGPRRLLGFSPSPERAALIYSAAWTVVQDRGTVRTGCPDGAGPSNREIAAGIRDAFGGSLKADEREAFGG